MVAPPSALAVAWALPLAQAEPQPADTSQLRARLVLAVFGVLILGLLVLLLLMSAGRIWRRQLRKPLPQSGQREDDWFQKPLTPPDSEDADDQSNQ